MEQVTTDALTGDFSARDAKPITDSTANNTESTANITDSTARDVQRGHRRKLLKKNFLKDCCKICPQN